MGNNYIQANVLWLYEEQKIVIHGKIHPNSIFFLCILRIRIIILQHRNTAFEEILFEKDTITRQKKSFE